MGKANVPHKEGKAAGVCSVPAFLRTLGAIRGTGKAHRRLGLTTNPDSLASRDCKKALKPKGDCALSLDAVLPSK